MKFSKLVSCSLLWLVCTTHSGFQFISRSCADDNIPVEKNPLDWQADAELTDVFFLNSNLGWAVGAQGTILRTINGGQNWLEISQANATAGEHLSLDQKVQALQNGITTKWTGVTDDKSLQDQPYRCRFESVCFVDELHGWVAGGYKTPYVDRSRAVVLKTSDGGISWRAVKGIFAPRFKKIQFSDRANGWALGDEGNLFRTGICFTADGGETWSSQSSQGMADWIDGEQTNTGFVNISATGQLAVINNQRLEPSVLLGEGQVFFNRIRLFDQTQGLAIGNEGAVWTTNNAGRSWSPLAAESPADATKPLNTVPSGMLFNQIRQFDLSALSISPTKIWFAGNPGTIVFSIDRQTGSLTTNPTGMALPIKDLHFVDDQYGWAVGTLGTILATDDGGKNWVVQRGQHRGVAVLGVALEDRELPLEALADLSGEENRVCAAAVLTSTSDEAVRQSVERLGCVTLVNVAGSAPNGNSKYDQQLEKMVRTIRTLRPTAIINNSDFRVASTDGSTSQLDPIEFLKVAIQAAADRTAYPEQLEYGRLEVWSVDRLASRSPTGSVSFDPQRMLPRVGTLIEDKIALSRALLGLPIAAGGKRSYRVDCFSIANQTNEGDLLSGLDYGGRPIPTRNSAGGFRGSLNAIQLANSKQQKLDEFARFDLRSEQDSRIWNQQLLSWALSLDENVAGIWLAQLAQQYLQQGNTELASRTMEVLASRFTNHALAPAAITWLVHYNASDEFGQIEFQKFQADRQRQQSAETQLTRGGNQQATAASHVEQSTAGGVSQLVWTPVADAVRSPQSSAADDNALAVAAMNDDLTLDIAPQQNQANTPADEIPALTEAEIKLFFESRWQRASQYLRQLGQLDPELISSRQNRALESQINRKLSGTIAAEPTLKQLIQSGDIIDGLATGAQRELMLEDLIPGRETMPALVCDRTMLRPHLDGLLDDTVWQNRLQTGSPIRLSAAGRETGSDHETSINHDPQSTGATIDGASPTDIVMLAYDEQFLYVAIRCQKLAGQYYQTTNDARSRDADLALRDRVVLSLDVDRDYRSTNDFVVDYRGWCHEGTSGALGWNPTWYIGRAEDPATWTVELAIPLDQLVPSKIQPETVWAIRLARLTRDEANVWKPVPVLNPVRKLPNPSGWQIGLISQPAEFDLLMFK